MYRKTRFEPTPGNKRILLLLCSGQGAVAKRCAIIGKDFGLDEIFQVLRMILSLFVPSQLLEISSYKVRLPPGAFSKVFTVFTGYAGTVFSWR